MVKPQASVTPPAPPGTDGLPSSARLPLVLLISLGTALIFHGVFWLLWMFVRNRF